MGFGIIMYYFYLLDELFSLLCVLEDAFVFIRGHISGDGYSQSHPCTSIVRSNVFHVRISLHWLSQNNPLCGLRRSSMGGSAAAAQHSRPVTRSLV